MVAFTALSVLSCSSGSSHGDLANRSEGSASERVVHIDGVELLEGTTSGAGSKLRDGLVVVRGSRLLADPFPAQSSPGPSGVEQDRGWAAQILVTGDPARVLAAYARQARRLDLPVPHVSCEQRSRPDTGEDPAFSCLGASADQENQRTFQMHYEWSGRSPGRGPLSHLEITYQNPVGASRAPGHGSGTEVGEVRLEVGDASFLPWGPLLTVGQAFEPGTGNNPGMAVAEGSRLVGPPGTRQAILRVDGDLKTVVRSYLREGNSTDVSHRRYRDDGFIVDDYCWTNGDGYTVTSYQRPGRPTWLVVEHSEGD